MHGTTNPKLTLAVLNFRSLLQGSLLLSTLMCDMSDE